MNNQLGLIAKMTFTTLFNGYAAHGFHGNVYTSVLRGSWRAGSLSTKAGEFGKCVRVCVCQWKLFEDRGGGCSIWRNEGENNMKSNNGMRLREMIYGDVQLRQVSAAEELAVSCRDKKRQIECFPDRQGDNPAFCECKQEHRYLSLPDDGVNTSVHQLGFCQRSLLRQLFKAWEEGRMPLLLQAYANMVGRRGTRVGTRRQTLPEFYYFPSLPQ